MKKELEILAPAGGMESLRAVIQAGADAVYMGGSRFGARAFADNPEGDMLLQAIDYAHLYGVRFYLTVNTLLKERELEEELYAYLKPCYEHGLDAVIVQDMGVLRAVQEWFPGLSIHASTQMSVTGVGGARLLQKEGVERVVLARELSLEEIAGVHKEVDVELECFVHGALCYCYSGQCLFSSVLGGRSGNRGRCAQPCRLQYEAIKGREVLSKKGENALLSPKDICTLSLLPKIVKAGVCSLKIEGRMKKPEYAAGVVRIYRKYANWYLAHGTKGYQVSKEDERELLQLFNRDGFSKGYYEQHNGRNMMALWNKAPSKEEKQAYEILSAKLRANYVEKDKKIPIKGKLCARLGEPLEFMVWKDDIGQESVVTVTGETLQKAKNRPMGEEQFRQQLEKIGNTPFIWEELEIVIEGTVFVPVQALNTLRRDALLALQMEIIRTFVGKRGQKAREYTCLEKKEIYFAEDTKELHLSVETEEQLLAVLEMADTLEKKDKISDFAIYLDAESMEEKLLVSIERIRKRGWKVYIALPMVFRMKTKERYKKNSDFWQKLAVDGYVIRNLEEYDFLRRIDWKKEVILDANVYTWNQRSREFYKGLGITLFTNPLELNSRELSRVSKADSIQMIYGRYPMMVSAGCVHQTLKLCKKKPGMLMLLDRYQKEFPVKNYCKDCYNVIYNSQPLYLLDQMEELKKIICRAYRISFTTESIEEVYTVLKAWMSHKEAKGDFTRGHFKRGVE